MKESCIFQEVSSETSPIFLLKRRNCNFLSLEGCFSSNTRLMAVDLRVQRRQFIFVSSVFVYIKKWCYVFFMITPEYKWILLVLNIMTRVYECISVDGSRLSQWCTLIEPPFRTSAQRCRLQLSTRSQSSGSLQSSSRLKSSSRLQSFSRLQSSSELESYT